MNFSVITVQHLQVFPWKSFNPVECQQVRLLPSGAIENDRRWALIDATGNFINGKSMPLIHRIAVRFDDSLKQVTIEMPLSAGSAELETEDYVWPEDQPMIEQRFSAYFGQPVRFEENREYGFPDDQNSPGPTIIGSETLQALTELFPEVSYEQMRLRFRTNIELATSEPCWEDCLIAEPSRLRKFQIGAVGFWGVNPCQRCVVPSRHPETGEVIPGFQKTLAGWRKKHLQSEIAAGHFNHFYRLAVNTRLVENKIASVSIGDAVTVENVF